MTKAHGQTLTGRQRDKAWRLHFILTIHEQSG